MPYRYLGPSDFLGHGDKFYKPGQMVPISKDEAEHLMRYSTHRFEGIDQADVAPAAPAQTALEPIGDDGTPVKDAAVSQAEVKTVTASAAPVAAGQPSGASEKKD